MRKLLFIIPLGLSLTAMSCSSNETEATTDEITTGVQQEKVISKNVNVTEFAELINKGDGQLLDIRTPKEWQGGIIKDATTINFFDGDFKSQLSKLDKNQAVYIYCRSGGRSGKAAKQMKGMGFTKVYNLVGGIRAWSSAGKETVK